MIDSPGTVSPPRSPGPSAGSVARTASAPTISQWRYPLAIALSRSAGSASRSSGVQATSTAPTGSTGMPVCRAYSPSNA